MVLAQLPHGVHDATAHQPEVPDVLRQLDIAELAHGAIEGDGRGLLQPCVAFALAAARVDDVVALAPCGNQQRNDLGRVLEVGVDHDDRVAARMIQPGCGGDLLAEVARQVDHADVGVGRAHCLDDSQCCVAASVVDVDRLPRRIQRCHHGGKAVVHLADDGGLVERRNDNGDDGLDVRMCVHGVGAPWCSRVKIWLRPARDQVAPPLGTPPRAEPLEPAT